MTDKKCRRCRKEQPVSQYNRAATARDRLYPWCNSCRKAYRLEHNHMPQVKEGWRNSRFKRQYGITLTIYNEMFEAQKGSCAICGRKQEHLARKLSVDHDHKTGQVRALLCGSCNIGLGSFRESCAIIYSALSYLQTWARGPTMADDINFRKTALSKQGSFTPARKGMRAGVGVNPSPAPVTKTVGKKGGC